MVRVKIEPLNKNDGEDGLHRRGSKVPTHRKKTRKKDRNGVYSGELSPKPNTVDRVEVTLKLERGRVIGKKRSIVEEIVRDFHRVNK